MGHSSAAWAPASGSCLIGADKATLPQKTASNIRLTVMTQCYLSVDQAYSKVVGKDEQDTGWASRLGLSPSSKFYHNLTLGKMVHLLLLTFLLCKEEPGSRSRWTLTTVRVCPVEVLRPGKLQ